MGVDVYRGSESEMEEVTVAEGARVLVSQVAGGNGMPDQLGVGCARYEGAWNYHLNYDVAYYVIDGSLSIECGENIHTGHSGDIFFLEKGTDVRYDATNGGCTIFWVAYPGNWQEITDLPVPQK